MEPAFEPFRKIARLSRECVVTEKLDGTNGSIMVLPSFNGDDDCPPHPMATYAQDRDGRPWWLLAGSRSRFISPAQDNFAFARWVFDNADDLSNLGEGIHYGEWWGSGIQRGYGLMKGEKRFSLFNASRWISAKQRPACCGIVPTLWRGEFDTREILKALDMLRDGGSFAAPGFMKPEGIVIFHTQGNYLFKKTFEKDEAGKERGA